MKGSRMNNFASVCLIGTKKKREMCWGHSREEAAAIFSWLYGEGWHLSKYLKEVREQIKKA